MQSLFGLQSKALYTAAQLTAQCEPLQQTAAGCLTAAEKVPCSAVSRACKRSLQSDLAQFKGLLIKREACKHEAIRDKRVSVCLLGNMTAVAEICYTQ